ncbi:uncharacterized protein PAC_19350 [Phialocephala subalpina]|uniref:Zn(2)-C6 fungal-type domain-containing protein n=1 Tax=Phialocephala subalpina TaxID=576137 RepID=A0A1L7XWT1_9HELO|nr:uncharacterized protein PAC_19350 [Phialocephala subalpina]
MPESFPQDKKRRRMSKPKSKNGCITCKVRRVKCDEGKPVCLRCCNFGMKCDGYSVRRSRQDPRQAVRPILPSPSYSAVGMGSSTQRNGHPSIKARQTPLTKTPSTILTIPRRSTLSSISPSKEAQEVLKRESLVLMHCPSANRFKTQREYLYHEFFRSNVAEQLSGFMPSTLWNQSVLQAAEAEPFILDAVVAIAAMNKIISGAPDMRDWDAHLLFSDDHKFAVEKYQHSLLRMRRAILNGKMDARMALMACLLTICFENSYGRRDIALWHTANGLRLTKGFAIPMSSSGQSPPELSGSPSPMTCTVEDELGAVFSRLNISAMVLVDYRSGAEHQSLRDGLGQATRSMPREFTTIEEATTYGNMIISRCWHFIKIIEHPDREPNPYTPMEQGKRWIRTDIRYGRSPCSGWNPWTGTNETVPDKWLKEARTCADEMEGWFTAFNPLMRRFQRSPRTFWKEYPQATLLCLQAKSCLVSVCGSIYTRETDWDAHLPEFKEIVSLLDIYLASKPKQRYFVFDGETIAYLLQVVCKCRDGSVRRMALKLLEDRPRRESCWDTRYAAHVGRWVMTLEERGGGVGES